MVTRWHKSHWKEQGTPLPLLRLFSPPFPLSLPPPFLLPPSPSSLLPPFCVLVDFSWCTAGASCVQEKEHMKQESQLSFLPSLSAFCILCRWLMESAERSKRVCLAIIPSGLIEGLVHSVSRMDLLERDERTPVPRSRSMEQLLETTKPLPNGRLERSAQPSNFIQRQRSDHATKIRGSARLSRSSLHDHPLYAPSIGSRRESNQSLVSSTVETAAHIARSSMRSYSSQRGGAFKVCTSVSRFHLEGRGIPCSV